MIKFESANHDHAQSGTIFFHVIGFWVWPTGSVGQRADKSIQRTNPLDSDLSNG